MPISTFIRLTPAAALLCAACATAAPPVAMPGPAQLAEAAEALQGTVPDVFFRDEDLAAAAEAIAAVRRERPDLRDVHASSQSPLRLRLTDSAWLELVARFPDPAGDELRPRLGLRALDSVNAELGARGTRITGRQFSRTVQPIFDRPTNIPAAAARYENVPGVRYAGGTNYFGVSSGLGVRLDPDSAVLQFWRGWGDCLGGCIYNHGWTFRYDRHTRRVTLLRDTGDPMETAGLKEWLRRPDWAAFDRLSEYMRHRYARAMAEDARTPLRIIRGLAPRLHALPGFYDIDTLRARPDVRRNRRLMEQLATLSGDDEDARCSSMSTGGPSRGTRGLRRRPSAPSSTNLPAAIRLPR